MTELTISEALRLGIEAHKAGRIKEADRYYTAILGSSPEHPDANHNLGVLAVGIGQVERSLPYFKKALEQNKSILQFWVSLADAYLKLKKYNDARDVLNGARASGLSGKVLDELTRKLSDVNVDLQRHPLPEDLDGIINLYNTGEFEKALEKATDLIKSSEQPLILHNVCGAANAALKRYDAAIENYKSAIDLNPNYADAFNNMGIAQQENNDLDGAISSYNKAIEIKPNFAEAFNNLGNLYRIIGNYEEAHRCGQKAIHLKPDYPEAYNNLGNTFFHQKHYAKSIDFYQKAVQLNDQYVDALYNLAVSQIEIGDIKNAFLNLTKVTSLNQSHAQAFFQLGYIYEKQSKWSFAYKNLLKGLELQSDNIPALVNIGNISRTISEPAEAIKFYNKALKLGGERADIYANIAAAYLDLSLIKDAKVYCEKAVRIDPKNYIALFNLGVIYNHLGNKQYAEKYYKKSLIIQPDMCTAHFALSKLIKYSYEEPHLSEMEKLVRSKTLDTSQMALLRFGLAKAYSDTGDLSKSYDFFTSANKLRREVVVYDSNKVSMLADKLIGTASTLKKLKPLKVITSNDPVPIFIVGMPRSGTTLIEQIISAHSKVTGAGELPFAIKYGLDIAAGYWKANVDSLKSFRENYIRELKDRSFGAPFVTDKMPFNYRLVPLICRAFPEAKILHVQREPAAVCWSIFTQNFEAKELSFSFSLEEIKQYYRIYNRTMDHWISEFKEHIYQCNYEGLVEDQEYETRKMIQFLNLSWEPACLSPEENIRDVKTASQHQVRAKVYKGSSKEWEKYQPFLEGQLDQIL